MERVTLDFRVMGSSPMLGVEILKNKILKREVGFLFLFSVNHE